MARQRVDGIIHQPIFLVIFIILIEMIRKKFALLLCCFLFAFAVIVILILLQKQQQQGNGFSRSFKDLLYGLYTTDIKSSSYYIAGLSNDQVFLGNLANSEELLIIDYPLAHIKTIRLVIDDTMRIAWKAAKIVVDYPNIFLIEGITPTILHATFPKLNFRQLPSPAFQFDLAIPLSASTFAWRIYDASIDERILAKFDLHTRELKKGYGILEKQQDGVFSTDGLLMNDRCSPYLLHLYYYRNEYVILDTNLKVIEKAKTIDTVSIAQIKVGVIRSERSATLLAPAQPTNKYACVDNGYLFVHSTLMADNEESQKFKKFSVVDVYSIGKLKYLFSFYLPGKARAYKAFRNHFVFLEDHFIHSGYFNLPSDSFIP